MGEKDKLAESRDDSSTVGKLQLQAASSNFIIGDLEHPNKMPFGGVLTFLDVPSNKAPNGSGGKKVLIPKEVGLQALDSLKGMAVNYVAGTMDGHDPTEKIGIITDAWLGEPQADGAIPVHIEGYIFAHDFSLAAMQVKNHQEHLGFSYETARTLLVDGIHTGEAVAVVSDLGYFTGASILWKNSAAYTDTSLAASADEEKEELLVEEILKAIEDLKSYVDAKFESLEAKQEEVVNEEEVVEEAEVVEETAKAEEVVEEAPAEEEAEVTEDAKEDVPTLDHAVDPASEVTEVEQDLAASEEPEADAEQPTETSELNASAIQAELDAVKRELAELKANADIQAAARKSIAHPTSLMAKYAIEESEDTTNIFATIDSLEGLTIEQRIALKMEARSKLNK